MENWLNYLSDEDIFRFVCGHFDATIFVHDFERFKKRIFRCVDEETGQNKIAVIFDQGKFKKYNATFTMYPLSCNIQDGMINPWFSNSKLYKYKTTKNKDLMDLVSVDYLKLMIEKCGDAYAKEVDVVIKKEFRKVKEAHEFILNNAITKIEERFAVQFKLCTSSEKLEALKETKQRVTDSAVEKFEKIYSSKYENINKKYMQIFGQSIYEENVKSTAKIGL